MQHPASHPAVSRDHGLHDSAIYSSLAHGTRLLSASQHTGVSHSSCPGRRNWRNESFRLYVQTAYRCHAYRLPETESIKSGASDSLSEAPQRFLQRFLRRLRNMPITPHTAATSTAAQITQKIQPAGSAGSGVSQGAETSAAKSQVMSPGATSPSYPY